MSGLWVAGDDGSLVATKALWVAGEDGTWQTVKALHAADDTGTFQSAGLAGVSGAVDNSLGLVLRPGSPRHRQVVASWQSQGPVGTVYRVTGILGILQSYGTAPAGATSLVIDNLEPGRRYYMRLSYTPPGGKTVLGSVVSVLLDPMPAPANFRLLSLTPSAASFAWDPVEGATGYQLYGFTSGTTLDVGTTTNYVRAVSPGVAYDFGVRALYGQLTGALSGHLKFIVPTTIPAVAPGVRQYLPTGAATWQQTPGRWRPASEGLYHGDGRQWSSTRGVQGSWFFYGDNPFNDILGGRVVKFEVLLYRSDDAGNSTAQLNRWVLHNWTGQPAGPPQNANFPKVEIGALARGQAAWFELPIPWGQALVNGQFKGIGWGDVNDRYMRANPITQTPQNGVLRFTIG